MGFLNYDSPFMRVLRKIWAALIANFFFLLCCVPVVTAGMSLCSLYYVAEHHLKQDKGYAWSGFFRCFRQNWRQTLPAGAVIVVVAAVFWFDIRILRAVLEQGNSLGNLYILFYILLALLLVYAIWLFAMIARFENTLSVFLKNAAILMLRHLPVSLLILVVTAVFSMIMYVVPLTALVFPVLALWLLSAPLEKVFSRYAPEENGDGDEGEDGTEEGS